jgi:hypothetical protein
MSTLVQKFLTMADVYKQTNGREGIGQIIEVMNDTSQYIMDDWLMMECNDGTKHIHTIRTGLPSVSWGALYEGIAQSKSSSQQVTDTTGFVEALSTVDQRVLDIAGPNRLQVRMNESVSFIESMAQDLVKSMFYYDSGTNVRHPKGLGARFGALDTTGAGNQIIDGGGTGSDNTSIWFVTWSDRDFCGIYPNGTTGGIKQEDKGPQRVTDAAGNPYYVEEELFSAHMGWVVKDWRNISRVANIDVSNLRAGSVDIYKLARQAYYKLHTRRKGKVADQGAAGRTVMYCNTEVMEALDAAQTNSVGSDNYIRLRPMELDGTEVMSYRNIPIRETDAILNTEARVV